MDRDGKRSNVRGSIRPHTELSGSNLQSFVKNMGTSVRGLLCLLIPMPVNSYTGNYFDSDTAGDFVSSDNPEGLLDSQNGYEATARSASERLEDQLPLEFEECVQLAEASFNSPPFAKTKTPEVSEVVTNILIQVVKGTRSKVLFHYDGFSTEVYLKPGLDIDPLYPELSRLIQLVRSSVK